MNSCSVNVVVGLRLLGGQRRLGSHNNPTSPACKQQGYLASLTLAKPHLFLQSQSRLCQPRWGRVSDLKPPPGKPRHFDALKSCCRYGGHPRPGRLDGFGNSDPFGVGLLHRNNGVAGGHEARSVRGRFAYFCFRGGGEVEITIKRERCGDGATFQQLNVGR
jgi:hypothetical protein